MKRMTLTRFELVCLILTAAGIGVIFLPAVRRIKCIAPRMVCGTNLSQLGKALLMYANDNDSKYPTVDKWCDLLIEHTEVTQKDFVCRGALRASNRGRGHYAMNPSCEPNSPAELALLFDSKGGWNQSGEFNMLTLVNHKGEGCNVLFNDMRVAFTSLEGVVKLKWKGEGKE